MKRFELRRFLFSMVAIVATLGAVTVLHLSVPYILLAACAFLAAVVIGGSAR